VIRQIANAALNSLSDEFQKLYSSIGRESIPPERLMRALLLQGFYSIPSERQLVERIDTDLLFPWFVGLGIEDAVWDATTFTKNRDRLLDGAVASQFLAAVLAQDKVKRLLSSDHFSVDGTFARSLGEPQELSSQGRLGRAAGAGAQWRTGLPRRAPDQRHAYLDRTTPPPTEPHEPRQALPRPRVDRGAEPLSQCHSRRYRAW
jgi:transposase